jgi:two-component system, cell cycle sensor histidine kinase and response regulator CckA
MPAILVVDDRQDNRYLLEALLKAKGFDVALAANGQEALTNARQSPPDLIVTDILMPVMDGFSLCRQWRSDERLRSIPLIFYTATYTDPRDEEFALSLGADRFLTKPMDPDLFVRHINDVLSGIGTVSRVPPSASAGEVVYLQEYNQALIRKLEAKVQELEDANREMAVKDSAISSAISAIVLTDMAGRIAYANDSCLSLWGYRREELTGRSASLLMADPVAGMRTLRAVSDTGQWIGEMEARRKNGTVFTIQVTVHRVLDTQGTAVRYMASGIDVTEQKRMREELQRSHRMESLSLFAAGIAHDFNNLLTGLFVGLELIRDDLPPQGIAREQYGVIMSVFTRARDLTQRLLAFSKGGVPVQKKLAVADVVRESCALSLSGTRIHHELTVDKDAWLVMADASQLSQVFTNIIINARQAMGDQGRLDIAVGNRSLAEGGVEALPAGEYVSIQFTDNGPGIPETAVDRIFDPFFTTKKEGSGLGLATSYAIVKNHGGCIVASSRPQGGASFTVWLPACGERRQESHEEAAPPATGGDGRILLMDDEEAILKLARQILARAGYEVAIAATGEDALALHRKAVAAHKPFDLVILDLTIRGGMGGMETLAALQEITPRLPAIASSGYTDGDVIDKVKENGFLGLLPKPYRAHELLSTVKATMGREKASA